MSKTKTPTIKSTSVPSAYDTPMTNLEYLRKVEEQNAQVLARQDEIEEDLADKVNKSGSTMTGALNTPQVNADTGVFRHLNAVSQDGNTHVEVSNGGFIAEVTEETTGNKKYGVIAFPNGKVGFYAHDALHNKDVNFIIPNMDDYEAGTYELATKDDIPSGGSSLLEDIEDEDGHKRFQSIDLISASQKIEMYYAKCLVNGLSMTIVMYFKTLQTFGNTNIATCELPSWIMNKLITVDNVEIIAHYSAVRKAEGSSYQYVTDYGNVIKEANGIRLTSDVSVNANTYIRVSVTLGL